MWMANSYSVQNATVVDVTSNAIVMEVTIQEQGKKEYIVQSVEVDLNSSPLDTRNYKDLPKISELCLKDALPIDNFVRRVNRLCNIVKAYEATGKMIQMGVQLGGAGVGKLVRKFVHLMYILCVWFFCYAFSYIV
jgi:hypothetical protein